MNCPYCGKEMKEGYLNARPPVAWTPKKIKMTVFCGRHDVRLNGFFDSEGLKAYLCEDCKKVIVDYE